MNDDEEKEKYDKAYKMLVKMMRIDDFILYVDDKYNGAYNGVALMARFSAGSKNLDFNSKRKDKTLRPCTFYVRCSHHADWLWIRIEDCTPEDIFYFSDSKKNKIIVDTILTHLQHGNLYLRTLPSHVLLQDDAWTLDELVVQYDLQAIDDVQKV